MACRDETHLSAIKVFVESDLEAKTVEVVGNAGPFEVRARAHLMLAKVVTGKR